MKKFNINTPVGFRDYFLQDMAKKNKMESMLSVGSVHIKKQVKIENGCKWINLPKKHEKQHTIYMKFNGLAKKGTIAKAIAFFL